MWSRLLKTPSSSFFLFGPRGTGKTLWTERALSEALSFDLLDSRVLTDLLASPGRLEDWIAPDYRGWVVLDEVQRVPALLDHIHRMIEKRRGLRFALTGSSARRLKRKGVNLLAGRAETWTLHPMTAAELGKDFDLKAAIRFGTLPRALSVSNPAKFLKDYVATYLKEEVQQEGLTRNLGAFARFLEAASFSQGQPLNVSSVARECAVERKVVEDYFIILQDLLLSHELPVFAKKAKRKLATHRKFYFFDAGVFRAIRPRGPLDLEGDVDGVAFETLVLNELVAQNAYRDLGYSLHHWRVHQPALEVDFALYGERGLIAIEAKLATRVREEDLGGLRAFGEDYPSARLYLVYGGQRRYREGRIECLPALEFFSEAGALLAKAR